MAHLTGKRRSRRFTNQTMSPSCYLQSTPGAYLTLTGAAANEVPVPPARKDGKVLRPTGTSAGATKIGCPDELFSHEWMDYRTYGVARKSGFTGTVDRINNDGEYGTCSPGPYNMYS